MTGPRSWIYTTSRDMTQLTTQAQSKLKREHGGITDLALTPVIQVLDGYRPCAQDHLNI